MNMIQPEVRIGMESFVVIDVETTGFGTRDRIVEIAAVTLDPDSLETLDEYDTLINPERDVGPTCVHGITASMVEAAPVFREVVAEVGRQLNGNVLIAHNLPFDARMLHNEFRRHHIPFDKGAGMCTLRVTRQKLGLACEDRGISRTHDHRALSDARATAELARKLRLPERWADTANVRIGHIPHAPNPRTLRRGFADGATSPMQRVVSRARYPHADEAVCHYLYLLDWVLDDGVIDAEEQSELDRVAREFGISDGARRKAHKEYFGCIVTAAERDGVITQAEHELMTGVADQLGISHTRIPAITPAPATERIPAGSRVCFTGAVTMGSEALPRELLERMAEVSGFRCVRSVTRSGCDVLIAADVSSASSKTRNARKWGIPVVSAADFLAGCAPE